MASQREIEKVGVTMIVKQDSQKRFQAMEHYTTGFMMRRGFRQRVIRYVAFLLTFFLLYGLWAALFGKYDFILAALKALPFSLTGVVVLDLVGLGPWIRKRQVTRAIPTFLLVVAIVVILVYGELWAVIPLVVLLAWIIGYVWKQQFLGHGGGQTVPPRI